MNLSIGLSNGAVKNIVVDDPLTTKIHIAMQISPDNYVYWFSLKNNSTDYPYLSAYHYGYSDVMFSLDKLEKNAGYSTYEIKRKAGVVSLVLTFYDRSYLDKFIGSTNIETDTHARRIMMRFFTDCEITDVAYSLVEKQWQANLITLGEIYNNQRIITEQVTSLGRQLDTAKADIYTNRSVLNTVQTDLRTANKNIITVSNGLEQEKEIMKKATNDIINLDRVVGILMQAEKQIVEEDTALAEAVLKIQTFLSNVQIATSDSKKFIKFNATQITVPPKDLLFEITQVQQKLESIKDQVNKLNNVQLTKVVNYKPKNTFKF